ncbi:MAG TPA: SRPBCC domain-containing protein [Candidatus Dormibacteraeota bacterium]|jgi:uncharacterized protein YndB with AHSA1/START domain|nr:SRPBCC domain-containing protein [Candidatus Dormibacteraeota bacterium]
MNEREREATKARDPAAISICYRLDWRRATDHDPDRVWQAITAPDEIEAWMGYPADVDPRRGGRYHIDFSGTDEGEIDGVITELEQGRALAYSWGLSIVRWELEAAEGGCVYTFCHHGLSRPDARGLGAGWHGFLEQLAHHLAGDGHRTVDHLPYLAAYEHRIEALDRH